MSDDDLRNKLADSLGYTNDNAMITWVMQLISERDKSHNQQIALEARKDQLDKLIDINSATFNRWTQKDIAHFFEDVGRQYREVEAELETLKSKKEEV
jgi:uncharacterized membrane protein YheB (UPF0754 family)